MIKRYILPLISILAVANFSFAFGSELDRSYRSFGISFSSVDYSDIGADSKGIAIVWDYGSYDSNFVSQSVFSYDQIDVAGATGDLLSTSWLGGYRIQLSDVLDIVPGVGFNYRNLSSSGWAIADVWSFSYGVMARYSLLENTTISAGFYGESGDLDSWVDEIDGLSVDSTAYGVSVEQFFSDAFSMKFAYATNAFGADGFSIGFNFLY